ncbi:hypothetical protein CEXT_239971, partial [Caerostris extrusa]
MDFLCYWCCQILFHHNIRVCDVEHDRDSAGIVHLVMTPIMTYALTLEHQNPQTIGFCFQTYFSITPLTPKDTCFASRALFCGAKLSNPVPSKRYQPKIAIDLRGFANLCTLGPRACGNISHTPLKCNDV